MKPDDTFEIELRRITQEMDKHWFIEGYRWRMIVLRCSTSSEGATTKKVEDVVIFYEYKDFRAAVKRYFYNNHYQMNHKIFKKIWDTRLQS